MVGLPRRRRSGERCRHVDLNSRVNWKHVRGSSGTPASFCALPFSLPREAASAFGSQSDRCAWNRMAKNAVDRARGCCYTGIAAFRVLRTPRKPDNCGAVPRFAGAGRLTRATGRRIG